MEGFLKEYGAYYQEISLTEAIQIVTDYLTNPPLKDKYKAMHSQMISEAVKRNHQAKEYLCMMISKVLDSGPYHVPGYSSQQLIQTLYQDLYGMGPIEALIEDPEVQEINVNGYDNIWFEKRGKKCRAPDLCFISNEKLSQVIDRCLPNKEVNRLDNFAQSNYDGSRIYVGIPPVAKTPYLNYRKFSVFKAAEESYLQSGTLNHESLEVLKLFVRYRANITIIGPQNTGKTTLLSFLTDYYPPDLRIGVLESPDFEVAIEQRRPKGNIFFLKTEPRLGVTELDIFKHALRFSADVLIIPEARGAEMEEVLKAQRRGSQGSMTTAHSIAPKNLIDDMVLMISENGKPYRINIIKRMVAKALDIVVTMHHCPDGTRKVIGISEVDFDDWEERVEVHDLFAWENNRLVRTCNTISAGLADRLCFHGALPSELTEWGLLP